MLRTIKSLGIAVLLAALISCNKDDETPANPNIEFRATLAGSSEVPGNPSTATGTSTLTFNKDTKIFTVTTTYSGIATTVTGAHIHKAAVGTAGGIIFPFGSALASPIVFTSAALTADQETDLMAHLYYTNVHSTTYPGGEIRGQLIKQ